MSAPGETDLEQMLATLAVEQRPGVFTYVATDEPTSELLAESHATISEGSTTTFVLPVEAAESAGHPVPVRLAWLSLTVQSSLEAVGLTAAVSALLTAEGIPCNVLAGYYHDHLLVPTERAADAIRVLTA